MAARAPKITTLPREEQLTEQIRQVLALRRKAMSRGSFTAASKTHDQEARLLAELHELRESQREPVEAVDPTADLGDDALTTLLVEAVPQLPAEAFDQLEQAVHLRRTGRPLLRVASE